MPDDSGGSPSETQPLQLWRLIISVCQHMPELLPLLDSAAPQVQLLQFPNVEAL